MNPNARMVRGIVLDDQDATHRGGLRVSIPEMSGDAPWDWVWPVASNTLTSTPKVGDIVNLLVTEDTALWVGRWNRLASRTRKEIEARLPASQFGSGRDALLLEDVDDDGNVVATNLDPDHPTMTLAEQAEQARQVGNVPTLVQLADAAAREHGIPIHVFRGMIWTESTWRPDQYNPKASLKTWGRMEDSNTHFSGHPFKDHSLHSDQLAWGAYGLVQVLLGTALDNGLKFDAADPIAVLLNPVHNLRIGAKALQGFYRLALARGGEWELALAMYHSGKAHKSGGRWVKHTADPTTWLKETREIYVPKFRKFAAQEASGKVGPSKDTPAVAVGLPDESTSDFSTSAEVELPAVSVFQRDPEHPERSVVREAVPAKTVQTSYAYYGTEYPHSAVLQSRTPGHQVEVDDTPDHERIRIRHVSGSFWEQGPQGQVAQQASARFETIRGPDVRQAQSKTDITLGNEEARTGGQYAARRGSVNEEVVQDLNRRVGGNRREFVGGSEYDKVQGVRKTTTIGPHNITAVELQMAALRSVNLRANRGSLDGVASQDVSFRSVEGDAYVLVADTDKTVELGGGRVVDGALQTAGESRQAILLKPALEPLVAALGAIIDALEAFGMQFRSVAVGPLAVLQPVAAVLVGLPPVGGDAEIPDPPASLLAQIRAAEMAALDLLQETDLTGGDLGITKITRAN